MLKNANLVAFVTTAKPDRAKTFYQETLGLTLVDDTPVALVFDANGTTLRVVKVETHAPSPGTVLGWDVQDIANEVDALAAKGITFERFDGMPQDQRGIWQSPSGAKVAWFKDPDGNLLSLTES